MLSSLTSEQILLIHLVAIIVFLVLLLFFTLFLVKAIKNKKELVRQTDLTKEANARSQNLNRQSLTYEKRIDELENQSLAYEQRLDELAPYYNMADAFGDLEREREKIKGLKKQARDLVNLRSEESDSMLKQARQRADSVLDSANARAKDIAGEAWEAKEKYDFYRKSVSAMQNKIEGYGDEYLIPNETLIDDIAEEYGHEEAGQKLKLIRNQIKMLIKDGQAADCDYREAVRRQRSIEFALDAYNGKAETILAKVKTDNYGVMKKKLDDAEQLVNYNGIPFKNARVLPRYAELYQTQLKLAIQVKELKQRDKDEQRRIKAEMREEERVQRELKKAQQLAEKEQKSILKAVKEAEAKLSESAKEERMILQTKLDELMNKLSEAESKNQRALSMAQQTKQGHIYVISNIGSFGENVFKVGMTRRLEPLDRIKELSDASVPFNFDIHAIVFSEEAPRLERYLHAKLNDKRVNKVNIRKEFFSTTLGEVRAEVETLGLECHWTMKAEALEHRESIQLLEKSKTPQFFSEAEIELT